MSDELPVNEAKQLRNSQTRNSVEEGTIQMVPVNRDDAQGKFLSIFFLSAFWTLHTRVFRNCYFRLFLNQLVFKFLDEQYDSGHNAAGNAQDSGSRN